MPKTSRLRSAASPSTARLASGMALLWLGLLGSGCRSNSSASARPSASQVHVYGLLPNEPVPTECRAYSRGVLKCMTDSHFPANAKDAQLSALVQMMDRIKLANEPSAAREEALADAAHECRDSLNTLQLSSQQSCPGAL